MNILLTNPVLFSILAMTGLYLMCRIFGFAKPTLEAIFYLYICIVGLLFELQGEMASIGGSSTLDVCYSIRRGLLLFIIAIIYSIASYIAFRIFSSNGDNEEVGDKGLLLHIKKIHARQSAFEKKLESLANKNEDDLISSIQEEVKLLGERVVTILEMLLKNENPLTENEGDNGIMK